MKNPVARRLLDATLGDIHRLRADAAWRTPLVIAVDRAKSVLLLRTVRLCEREVGRAYREHETSVGANALWVVYAAALCCCAWPRLHLDEIDELTRQWDELMSDNVGERCRSLRERDLARRLGFEGVAA